MNDSVNSSCKSSELTDGLNISPHTNASGDAESTAAVELVADVAKPSMFPIEKASVTFDKGPTFPLPTDVASGPNDKHNGNATGDHRGKQKTGKSAPKMNKATNESAPRSFHNQDVYIRMNYLFHAAHYISTIAAATGHRHLHDLSSSYTDTACKISQRTVCRLAPETKTLVCKRCHAYLIAGETARVRVVRTASDDLSSERQEVLKARKARRLRKKSIYGANPLPNTEQIPTNDMESTIPSNVSHHPATENTDTYESNKIGVVRVIWTCHRCQYNNVRINADADDES